LKRIVIEQISITYLLKKKIENRFKKIKRKDLSISSNWIGYRVNTQPLLPIFKRNTPSKLTQRFHLSNGFEEAKKLTNSFFTMTMELACHNQQVQ
jgi:hypothetical protein